MTTIGILINIFQSPKLEKQNLTHKLLNTKIDYLKHLDRLVTWRHSISCFCLSLRLPETDLHPVCLMPQYPLHTSYHDGKGVMGNSDDKV